MLPAPDVVLRFQSKLHLPSEQDLAGLLSVSFSSVASGSLFSLGRPIKCRIQSNE